MDPPTHKHRKGIANDIRGASSSAAPAFRVAEAPALPAMRSASADLQAGQDPAGNRQGVRRTRRVSLAALFPRSPPAQASQGGLESGLASSFAGWQALEQVQTALETPSRAASALDGERVRQEAL